MVIILMVSRCFLFDILNDVWYDDIGNVLMVIRGVNEFDEICLVMW